MKTGSNSVGLPPLLNQTGVKISRKVVPKELGCMGWKLCRNFSPNCQGAACNRPGQTTRLPNGGQQDLTKYRKTKKGKGSGFGKFGINGCTQGITGTKKKNKLISKGHNSIRRGGGCVDEQLRGTPLRHTPREGGGGFR